MKDILTISLEDFTKCLPGISFNDLKNIQEGLFKYIKNNEWWMQKNHEGMKMLTTLERKQSKIMKEYQRRGILKKNDQTNVEFHNWFFNLGDKKRVW